MVSIGRLPDKERRKIRRENKVKLDVRFRIKTEKTPNKKRTQQIRNWDDNDE